MNRRLAIFGAAALAVAASVVVFVQPASAAVGLHISGRNIVEANGQNFIMRGINHEHVWFTGQTRAFADIKAAGANTIRVVLGDGHRNWGTTTLADVTNVISLCKTNKLICVLEDHDTTGFGEQSGASSLDQAADFWIGLKSAIVGQESYVVINIGNEPIGNTNAAQWTAATVAAIQKMRNNGFANLLMVDAPNWGQDWQFTMRDNAATVLAADTQHNTVLSIHMYDVFNTTSAIQSYLQTFQTNNWPLVIGEFGWKANSNNVDDAVVMSEAQARGLGYMGWSWSGNSDPVLDMVPVSTWDPTQLTTWGQRIVNGANGLKATSKEATIYSGATSSPSPTASRSASPSPSPSRSASPSPSPSRSASPSPSPSRSASASPTGGAKSCSATYSITGSWPNGFQGDVKVTAGGSAITAWTVTWTFANGQTITQIWSATVTASGSAVTAKNVSYNGSVGANASVNFGFLGSWNNSTNAVPTLSCTAT
jgi:mannan endo-1,4-beta-mannosidase